MSMATAQAENAIEQILLTQDRQIESLRLENTRLQRELDKRSFRQTITAMIGEVHPDMVTFLALLVVATWIAAAVFGLVVAGHYVWPNGGN